MKEKADTKKPRTMAFSPLIREGQLVPLETSALRTPARENLASAVKRIFFADRPEKFKITLKHSPLPFQEHPPNQKNP